MPDRAAGVPAHLQRVTNSYTVVYPAHEPREDDPHYRDFEDYRRRTKASAVCAFGASLGGDFSLCAGGLELHHAHIEFALANGVDLSLLEARYPGVSDASQVGAWVESADNLTWLCLTSGTPILMADGSQRPVAEVMPGDSVITFDGTPQVVTGVSRNEYRGDVVTYGAGAGLTPSHRMLTDGGWAAVSEIVREVRVHGPDVIRVRREEYEVARVVAGTVPVNVVNALGTAQLTADQFAHDRDMLHDLAAAGLGDADVTFGGQRALAFCAVHDPARQSVEARYPARVRAVVNEAHVAGEYLELHSAACAGRHQAASPAAVAPQRAASGRAAGVVVRKRQGNKELLVTDGALPQRERRPLAYGRWDAVPELKVVSYSGYVHDLNVAHNHSMVAGGLVVHNCEKHHRSHGGVHHASASDFEAEHFIRNLIS